MHVISQTDFTRCSFDEMSEIEKKKREKNLEHLFEWILKCKFYFHSFQYGRIDSGVYEAGSLSVLLNFYVF